MVKEYEKYLTILLKVALIGIVILGVYYLGTTMIYAILPFVTGWLIASMIEPLIHFLKRNLKFPHGIAAFTSLLTFILVVALIVTFISSMIVIELTAFSTKLPEYSQKLYETGQQIVMDVQDVYIQLPEDVSQSMLKTLNSVLEKLTIFMSIFLTSILSFVSSIPKFLIFLVVTFISAFFFARDKELIQGFVVAQVKPSWLEKANIIKQDLLVALVGYIRAQLILMSFTFIISITGMLIIGVKYAFLLAFIASLLDALPVLGTGSVYVPMIIWHVFHGDYMTAVYVGILYGTVILVRQMLEPKVLGTQIGLHPLSTLLAMYMGLQIFGVFGLLLGPVTLIVLLSLQKTNLIPKWKKQA